MSHRYGIVRTDRYGRRNLLTKDRSRISETLPRDVDPSRLCVPLLIVDGFSRLSGERRSLSHRPSPRRQDENRWHHRADHLASARSSTVGSGSCVLSVGSPTPPCSSRRNRRVRESGSDENASPPESAPDAPFGRNAARSHGYTRSGGASGAGPPNLSAGPGETWSGVLPAFCPEGWNGGRCCATVGAPNESLAIVPVSIRSATVTARGSLARRRAM